MITVVLNLSSIFSKRHLTQAQYIKFSLVNVGHEALTGKMTEFWWFSDDKQMAPIHQEENHPLFRYQFSVNVLDTPIRAGHPFNTALHPRSSHDPIRDQ